MRLVVDTNVFVSASLKAGSWPAVVVRWVDKHAGLLKSSVTEHELLEVLQRPRIASLIAPVFLKGIYKALADAELVTITERVVGCRDPKDDKFLELAINGRADAIVSGDADLLALDSFRGIPIITPAAFGLTKLR